jgi:hypothetical protein
MKIALGFGIGVKEPVLNLISFHSTVIFFTCIIIITIAINIIIIIIIILIKDLICGYILSFKI